MRNLWCLEKISILPLVISATGIVPQSLFKNLKILDFDNTLVVEIQKGILLYYYYFTLFYPTGFKGFLYFTVLNKLTIPKSFFFLF
jgi:hypothetical protein